MQLLADADLDFGKVVLGQIDAFDRANRLSPDQHLVIWNELARVLEDQLVLVLAVASEDDYQQGDHNCREPDYRRNSGRGSAPALGRAFLLA